VDIAPAEQPRSVPLPEAAAGAESPLTAA
jgi:hypothetical protein